MSTAKERLAARLAAGGKKKSSAFRDSLANKVGGGASAGPIPEKRVIEEPPKKLSMKERLAQKLNNKKAKAEAGGFRARLGERMNSDFNKIDGRRDTMRPGSTEMDSMKKEVTRADKGTERELVKLEDLEVAQDAAAMADELAKEQIQKAKAAQAAAAEEAEEAAQAAKEAEDAEAAAAAAAAAGDEAAAAELALKAVEARKKAEKEQAEALEAQREAAAEDRARKEAEAEAALASREAELEAQSQAAEAAEAAAAKEKAEAEQAAKAAEEAEKAAADADPDDPMAAMLIEAAKAARVKAEQEAAEAEAAEAAAGEEEALRQLAADDATSKKNEAKACSTAPSGGAEGPDLAELEEIGLLGAGTFGSVTLVKYAGAFQALKALSKAHIVDTENEDSVLREKEVMEKLSHWSTMTLTATYKTSMNLYFLMPVCLGGEMFGHLRVMGEFDHTTCRFYAGCVTLALEHLQSLNIVYRDMKPENCLLDEQGYLKLVDFGCAKVLDDSGQTFSMCGTPDYTAPEMIIGDGHGVAVDWWALGILIYEMLVGKPPFLRNDPVQTFTDIVQLGQKCIDFPKTIGKVVIDLIRRLLLYNPDRRLGMNGGSAGVRKHAYFKKLDWEKLEKRELTVPIDVDLEGPDDLTNFRLVPLPTENEFDDFIGEECDWDPDF